MRFISPGGPEGSGWQEPDWNKLLSCIQQKTVIPIIGKDLLEVQPKDGGERVHLYQYLADKLIEGFGVKNLRSTPTLSDVVYSCLQDRIDYYDIRHGIISIMEAAQFEPPTALVHLAEITDFNLFVSTTFDPLMEMALNQVRFQNRPNRLEVRSYDPKEPLRNEDLDYGSKSGQQILFHLMGRLGWSSDNVAISEEDLLEFVCALHSETRIPKKLFDEFQNRHILLLGCSFSDWLSRFFLRAAKRRRLSESRMVVEFVVDDCTIKDENLVLFLQHFSRSTRFYRSGNAIAFTKELRDRWLEKNPKKAISAAPAAPLTFQAPAGTMPPHSIFISYASQDVAEAHTLKAQLDTFGLPVWFDKDQLESGETFESKISRNIKECDLFIPVISARTEARPEGFFRREWRLAANRELDYDRREPFIIPVVLDETSPDMARVPDCFVEVQWEKCPGGMVKPEFARRLEMLLNAKKARRNVPNTQAA